MKEVTSLDSEGLNEGTRDSDGASDLPGLLAAIRSLLWYPLMFASCNFLLSSLWCCNSSFFDLETYDERWRRGVGKIQNDDDIEK